MVCRPTYFSTVDNWWVANLFCSFRNYFLCLYRPGRRTPWEIRIGGVNVFGGGLALYNAKGVLIGGLGVSGDSSCADHNIAWRTRHNLKQVHAWRVPADSNSRIGRHLQVIAIVQSRRRTIGQLMEK